MKLDHEEAQYDREYVEPHGGQPLFICLCQIHSISPLRFVMDPLLPGLEQQNGGHTDDGDQHPGQCTAVAHVEVVEGPLVHIQHIAHSAVHRAAVGDDFGLGEHTEAVDDLEDQIEEDRSAWAW